MLDARILGLYVRDSRRSYRRAARRLGCAEATVQKRLARLVDIGVIRSFEIVFDPAIVGLTTGIADLSLDLRFDRDAVVAALARLAPVEFALFALRPMVMVMFHYASSREYESIVSSLSAVPFYRMVRTSIPRGFGRPADRSEPVEDRFSALDWQLLHALNHNARTPTHILAQQLGVSARTITRHLSRLIEGGLRFSARIDLANAAGAILYTLAVDLAPGANKDRVYHRIRRRFDAVWGVAGPVLPTIVLFAFAPTLAAVGDTVEAVKGLDGVQRVRSTCYTALYTFESVLDRALAERSVDSLP